MKIIEFKAENIKRLVVAEISPKGNMVEITGRNGQGKSSLLDSIWWALAGMGAIQKNPIRKGAESARIKLDLGEIIVTRTFKAGKDGDFTSSVTVESPDGLVFKSPQAVLDALVGKLSFDPLEFARMEPRKQFDVVKQFVPGVDFAAIEAQNRADYVRRTEINRRVKEARAAAQRIEVPADAPTARVDEVDLINQLEQAAAKNSDIDYRRRNREDVAEKIKMLDKESDRLSREASDMKNEAEALRKKLDQAPPLPAAVDVSGLRAKLDAARESNALFASREKKDAFEKEALRWEAEAEDITKTMERVEAHKQDCIAAANLPIPELAFGDGILLMNGVPFDQASDAEKLRTSVAIAMALNPKLRVIRVRDGSLLDDDSMKLLAEMAKDQDFQFWVETCHDRGVGFVLEDGHVRQAVTA